MEFNPNNNVIKLCIEGMAMEENGQPAEASRLFLLAWNEATMILKNLLLLIMWPGTRKMFPIN